MRLRGSSGRVPFDSRSFAISSIRVACFCASSRFARVCAIARSWAFGMSTSGAMSAAERIATVAGRRASRGRKVAAEAMASVRAASAR